MDKMQQRFDEIGLLLRSASALMKDAQNDLHGETPQKMYVTCAADLSWCALEFRIGSKVYAYKTTPQDIITQVLTSMEDAQ